MHFKTRPHQIPSRPHKPKPFTAKGPQDCVPLSLEQFAGATTYVAKAFLSAAVVPSKQFFAGVNDTGLLAGDGAKRAMLAAYAHFSQDPNLALSFFMRFRALLVLRQVVDLSAWVVQEPGSEYAGYASELLEICGRHPLQRDGQFDPESLLTQLRALTAMTPTELEPQPISLVAEPEVEQLAA